MNNTQIRVPKSLASLLMTELSKFGRREPVAFGFVSHATTPEDEFVLLREVVIPPEDAFLPSGGHGARWSGRYMIELLNQASEKQLGIVLFHFHGGSTVRMSSDDRRSALELLPKFQLVISYRPHGSIVLGQDSAAGFLLMPNQGTPTEKFTLRQFGPSMATLPLPDDSPRERGRFARQPLARGSLVRKVLARSKVAVVGQSGGGSHVALQLACLGVGEITGIDDDCVDEGNRFSGIAFGKKHVERHRPKVEVMEEVIRRIDPGVKYTAVRARLPEKEALEHLKKADIVVGCVNNVHARADIQEIALRYLIPYVDIGLGLNVKPGVLDEFPPVTSIGGNIFVFVPDGPCMWCTGFLTKEKLDAETQLRGRPYLRTADNVDALVVSFNGVLGSQAANEVLRLLTGFAPEDSQLVYRVYDGFTGLVQECEVHKSPACPQCAGLLAAGDPIWRAAA